MEYPVIFLYYTIYQIYRGETFAPVARISSVFFYFLQTNIFILVTRRVKGCTRFVGKYVTGRRKSFRRHKVRVLCVLETRSLVKLDEAEYPVKLDEAEYSVKLDEADVPVTL